MQRHPGFRQISFAAQSAAAFLAVLALVTTSSCNDVPVSTLCEGFTLQVDEVQTDRDAVKLDFLWIVDDSTSMCQEQASLGESIAAFTSTLESFINVDIRTAVTTTNALTVSKSGAFNTTPASEFPPLCQERRLFPARSDLHCECAACQGWAQSFEYQRCYDEKQAGGDCEPDPTIAPIYLACLSSGGCASDSLASRWIAESPPQMNNYYNLNGSVNASCRLRCGGVGVSEDAADAECIAAFTDDTMTCQMPGGDPNTAGCLKPPATAGCSNVDLPAVLPSFDAEGHEAFGLQTYFPCIATVGADQSTNANLEQGMKGAWLALDPNGERSLQICDPNDPILADATLSTAEKRERCERIFLRKNAFLIIIFLTDEDDCSVDDDKRIAAEDYNHCALLGDADTPQEDVRVPAAEINRNTSDRPLAPVFKYANRFRGLKSNPANVFVAAIVGDAWDPMGELDAGQVDAARQAYFASKTDRTNALRLNTYICASAFGRADLGLRYIELAKMFGPHGFSANICSDQGIGPALEDIAQELVSEVVSICLPRPARKVDGQEVLTVYKISEAGEKRELVQGQDFDVVDEPEQGACPDSGRAIRFDKDAVPLPSDTIRLLYEADASCEL